VGSQGARYSLACALTVLALNVVPAPCSAADEEQAIPIANFDKVSQGLWRGSAPSDDGLRKLADNGVKTVIDLRMSGKGTEKESLLAKKLGLRYIHIPMNYLSPSIAKIKDFLKIVTNEHYQPVFIHCRQGADRTGTLIGIYRVLVQRWTFEEAYFEMRMHHFKPWLSNLKRTVAELSESG